MNASPIHRCLLTLACALAATAVSTAAHEQGQKPAVLRIEAETDASGALNLRLSDRVRVTLTVWGEPPKQPVKLIDSPDWDVRAEKPVIETADGQTRWRQAFLVAPRKPGSLLLEPQPLTLGDTKTDWRPVAVKVTTEVGRADVKELRDILPPEGGQPGPLWWLWFAAAGGSVVGVVLLFVGWRVLRRLTVKPLKRLTPAEEALRDLDRIDKLKLGAEQYHARVADVVRQYAERRYQFRAPRQTTAEFLRSVQESEHLTAEQRERLREFLERCDVVKFAGERATAEACREVAAMARVFVVETADAPNPRQNSAVQ